MTRLPLPEAPPAAVRVDGVRLARYLDALDADIARGRLPGAVVLVARRGRVVLHEARGRLRPDADVPMPRDAVFRIYSMTKPVVSVAALRLFEQGRLHVAEPLARWLPAFASPVVGRERRLAARGATVLDLLRHTAGFSHEFAGCAGESLYAGAELGSRERDNAQLADALAALPLVHEPGSVWDYSRATDVLGRVIEVVCDAPLGEVLRREVFEPLGMHDSGFALPPDRHARLAEPHARDADSGAPIEMWDPRVPAPLQSGGSGLLSTVADYARFLAALSRGGELDGARLLGRKTVEWMTADHLGALPRAGTALPPGWGFGLGVAVRTHAGLAPDPGSVGSWGWSGASGTIFVVDPAEELFAIFMAQAPTQCERCWGLFRQMVYAAID